MRAQIFTELMRKREIENIESILLNFFRAKFYVFLIPLMLKA